MYKGDRWGRGNGLSFLPDVKGIDQVRGEEVAVMCFDIRLHSRTAWKPVMEVRRSKRLDRQRHCGRWARPF